MAEDDVPKECPALIDIYGERQKEKAACFAPLKSEAGGNGSSTQLTESDTSASSSFALTFRCGTTVEPFEMPPDEKCLLM